MKGQENKERYERAALEVICFSTDDVLDSSIPIEENDELDIRTGN